MKYNFIDFIQTYHKLPKSIQESLSNIAYYIYYFSEKNNSDSDNYNISLFLHSLSNWTQKEILVNQSEEFKMTIDYFENSMPDDHFLKKKNYALIHNYYFFFMGNWTIVSEEEFYNKENMEYEKYNLNNPSIIETKTDQSNTQKTNIESWIEHENENFPEFISSIINRENFEDYNFNYDEKGRLIYIFDNTIEKITTISYSENDQMISFKQKQNDKCLKNIEFTYHSNGFLHEKIYCNDFDEPLKKIVIDYKVK